MLSVQGDVARVARDLVLLRKKGGKKMVAKAPFCERLLTGAICKEVSSTCELEVGRVQRALVLLMSAFVSIRQHTSAYVSTL